MRIFAIGKPPGEKLLRIAVDFEESSGKSLIIASISIHGDFFAIPEERFEIIEQGLAGTRLEELVATFSRIAEKEKMTLIGISAQGIQDTIRKALDALPVQTD